MSDTPKFKVGDRVRSKGGRATGTVIACEPDTDGRLPIAFGHSGGIACGTWHVDDLTLVPAFPERWINVYPDSFGVELTCNEAEQWAKPGCIGVLHLRPDGTTEMLDPNTGEPI